jgi:hypothetical protein
MSKKNVYKVKLQELENFKNELFSIFGKKLEFNRFDFEKYIKINYNVSFYDSLQEYYDKKNINIKVDDIRDFVDVLAFEIVKSNYRVTEISGNYFNGGKNGSTFVYYSYKNSEIIDIFVHNSGLKYCNFWGIFTSNGEKKIIQNLEIIYH